MRHPTLAVLVETFGAETAAKLYAVLHARAGWREWPSAVAHEAQCFNRPDRATLKLYACDEILNTCGIEGFAYTTNLRDGLSYCNAGDSYSATLTFADRITLGRALRKAGLLLSGESLTTFRAEGDKVIAFPRASVWHSIILTHT